MQWSKTLASKSSSATTSLPSAPKPSVSERPWAIGMDLSPTIDLKGKRVTVMGLGRFGGGVGAVRFLASRGARLTVTDLLEETELAASLAEIADCGVETYRLGGHDESDFVEAELVIVNPAVPRSNLYLQRAREAGVPLSSEIALFWQFHPGRTAG